MSIENQLMLMEEYKISAEEWFFLQTLFLAQPEEDKSEYVYQYLGLQQNPKAFLTMLSRFQEVGIIKKDYKLPITTFYPESVEFNKNFLKKYLKYSGDLGKELFESYPNLIVIKGIAYSLKNIAKKYNSLEEFYFAYGKAIGHNPTKHEEVMSLLSWAKENDLINHNICEFVISHKWNELAEIKDRGFTGNNLNIDVSL